jgi:hypothetical protein
MNRALTPTHGGDTFGIELTKDRRFGSSRLNLAFKGLLLGASLHLRVKATSSNPRWLGLRIYNTFAHQKGGSIVFCREQRTLEVSERRFRWADGMKALGVKRAEVTHQRRLVGHQLKFTASALVCVIILLEC